MNLGFSQFINSRPTQFPAKILHGLRVHKLMDGRKHKSFVHALNKCAIDKPLNEVFIPKIHTIREDKTNRWKEGMKIHFLINNRRKNRLQFAPVLTVTSIQRIEIRNIWHDRHSVAVDGKSLLEHEIIELALYDGFDNLDDFWNFFKGQDFEGKLIHWTKHRY